MTVSFLRLDCYDLGEFKERLAANSHRADGIAINGTALGMLGKEQVAEIVWPIPLFLDLKLHDIPNTVAGAVRAVLPIKPYAITVHASGGPAMMRAAADAAIGPQVFAAVSAGDHWVAIKQARLARACGLQGVISDEGIIMAMVRLFDHDFQSVIDYDVVDPDAHFAGHSHFRIFSLPDEVKP